MFLKHLTDKFWTSSASMWFTCHPHSLFLPCQFWILRISWQVSECNQAIESHSQTLSPILEGGVNRYLLPWYGTIKCHEWVMVAIWELMLGSEVMVKLLPNYEVGNKEEWQWYMWILCGMLICTCCYSTYKWILQQNQYRKMRVIREEEKKKWGRML